MRERLNVSFFQPAGLREWRWRLLSRWANWACMRVEQMKTFRSCIVLAALALTCTAAMATPRVSHVDRGTPSLVNTTMLALVTNAKMGEHDSSAATPMFRLACGINVPTCYCKSGVPC